MNNWFMSAEIFSLVLMLILMLNFYEKRWNGNPKSRVYNLCLLMSTGSIALNILCVFTIEHVWELPLWINMVLNTGYFLLIVGMSTVMAHYLILLVFEHIYKQRGRRLFNWILTFLYAAYAILALTNFKHHALFYFDADRIYRRGPLINSGYVVMMIELFLLIFFTLRNLKSISTSMRRVMRILPPTILLLMAYQLIYPDVLFNGGLIVAANIILLVNFQNRRIEQDALTSAGNRISFYQEVALKLGSNQQFQIIVVSIRQFGTVNSCYGHENGDALMYEIAHWLGSLHKEGKAFRLGNVEFALLVPYAGIVSSSKLIDSIYKRFQEPWVLGDIHITLHTRFAELIYTDQDWNATDVLEFLNCSLSLTNERENQMVRFNEDIFDRIERRSHILRVMENAIQNNLFEIWYQPVYHCASGKFLSAEALLRLPDEDGSIISPKDFIPLAEQNGLIESLSRCALSPVFKLLSSNKLPETFAISLNVSMPQFTSPELYRTIRSNLEQFNCPPERLNLEITERVLSEDVVRMGQLIHQFTDLGIGVYMDDFGTGYSNLSIMLDCPFTCIKLDSSLIQDYPGNEKSSSLVNTLLDLFHTMGFQVVSEGVETKEQALALTSQGTDWIQGYYYARPMPEKEFIEFINNQKATVS